MTTDSLATAASRHAAPDRASGGIYAPRTFNRRSRQRFAANRRAELLRHLGRPASYPELLIIERICSIEFWVRALDVRIDRGDELSGHAICGRLAAETRLRLDLKDLGLQPAAARPMTGAEALAAIHARSDEAAA